MNLALDSRPVPRVLVVDDDSGLLEQIAAYLSEQGFLVTSAKNAREMDAALAKHTIDAIVLDVMMPGEDGLAICQRLQATGGPAIIMLSAMGEDVDRIVGLELGADDYLAKPCAPRELLARIRSVLRRRQPSETETGQPKVGYGFYGFRLDLWRHQLEAPNGVVILLTPGEFSLLQAFLERPNRILSRDQLLDRARGSETHIFDRAIDVQVSRLRRKLNSGCDRDLIRTYRGAGYLFAASVARL
ncbi:MAG TPA: response regulator [Caulobacteraceae bacterium]|jgi:two-component system OmpR family response regulator|nr:response regulator [Caulobacteraceae bacterium]